MTTQSARDARRTAFGGDARSVASPEALAAWERSIANYVPPGGPGPRQRLDDQSRTAAYDPAADQFDPRNMRPVDFQGQTLWTNNYDNLPVTPPPPATRISSSKDIAKKISGIVGVPDYGAPVTAADFGIPQLQAQPSSNYDVPPDQAPLQAGPYMGMPLSELMPTDRGAPPQVPTAGSPGLVPRIMAGAAPQLAPAIRAAQAAGSPQIKRYTDWRNRKLEGANQWLQDKLDAIGNWNGKIYAQGGPVGYAEGGYAGGGFLDDAPTDDGGQDFIPLTAFGGGMPQIGPSQAVMAPAPPPLMPSGGGGGGGKGGGGIGDLLGPIGAIAGSFIPGVGTMIGGMAGSALGSMMKADGGPIPMMRGGYPELYTRANRTAFSTGGGQNYVRPDGRGNGRSDHIDASLSPGEFVMDAETVSLAGDGDNNAGAREFERLRKNIRTHKGKQLAKGKFSPKAKPVESYMSGKLSASDRMAHAGVSDGMRQIGRH